MTDEATRAQNTAADPDYSVWLSANAGSGKTRVLTDRVARLLLRGTEPQNILCLTYTKAAASEMQNRLFNRLGAWAMMEDEALRAELAALGETPPSSLARARTLFARAVEAPGGLKIQTIHSFCSAVLRQFPLEAGVSPQFRELDDFGQKATIESLLDRIAETQPEVLLAIARASSAENLIELATNVAARRARFARSLSHAEIHHACGSSPDWSIQEIIDTVFADEVLGFLKGLVPIFAGSSKVTDTKLATALADLPDDPSASALEILEGRLLTQSGKTPFAAKVGAIPTKDLREGPFLPYLDRFNDIMQRVETARAKRVALVAAEKTVALHDFAQVFLPAYKTAKEDAGALDFDDLIERTGQLLTTRSLEWVLYRLDSGIEHILVDEAQDTSPAQWDVIDALSREIMAGEGVGKDRSIFVVGDQKQSIYSFQGADARVFEAMKDQLTARSTNGPSLNAKELQFSFRSSRAILSFVDTVFDGDMSAGLGEGVLHRAFHNEKPGRVDLWPIIPAPNEEDTPEWFDPVDRLAANDPKIQLAEGIAQQIEDLIDSETIIGDNGVVRPIQPGDFLILVQGRSALFDHIIRACKSRNLPMAGADRLKIGGELAVKDLLALLSFLALPEDDLSLASALRSPLFGWSERQLYELAEGRQQAYLWAELRDRQTAFEDTYKILSDLRSKVDFYRPYELIEHILNHYDGRRRLLARLGPEAVDGVDELLNQALNYERDAVPSLTGFLARARSADIEIKRQLDSAGGLIRVMTVHGAKGLEAPIVILPDTTAREKKNNDGIMLSKDGVPVWQVAKDSCPEILQSAAEAATQAAEEERQRLLYVAMTRAESWLIVCGAETKNSGAKWYKAAEASFDKMTTEPIDTPSGQGRRISHGKWPEVSDSRPCQDYTASIDVPDFLSVPARPQDTRLKPISPSELGGNKALPGSAQDEESAKRHGRQVHRLLEFLPKTDRSLEAARRVLAGGPDPVTHDLGSMLEEANSVIDRHPDLFKDSVLAEVDIAGTSQILGRPISGTIDRLVVQADIVTAIDFKSNPVVPGSPELVPDGILKQMGAYLEALEQIYPERTIELAVLWTAEARLMKVSHGIVRKALKASTIS